MHPVRTALVRAMAAATLFVASSASAFESQYLYTLADGSGPMAITSPRLAWDEEHAELYVVDLANGVINVFNDSGMVVHAFSDGGAGSTRLMAAVAHGDDVFVLSHQEQGWFVLRCNFRGAPVARLKLNGVPAEALRDFRPETLREREGRLYLTDSSAMKVLLVEKTGEYLGHVDLGALLAMADGTRPGLSGFSVDFEGNLLFTIAPLFQAYVVSPDGAVRSFGTKGSTPGKFNVVGGIASDPDGNLYITDKLRAVVSVFDRDFNFLGEFGHHGRSGSNLIAPSEVVVGNNRVYVTQTIGGVKTFGVRID